MFTSTTKLSNSQEYCNEHLKPLFAEFLLRKEYQLFVRKQDILFYKKGDPYQHSPSIKIQIRGVEITTWVLNGNTWEYKSTFTGLDLIQHLYEFICLLLLMKGIKHQLFTNWLQATEKGIENELLNSFQHA